MTELNDKLVELRDKRNKLEKEFKFEEASLLFIEEMELKRKYND